METYFSYCSSLLSNKNIPLLKNDQSMQGIDLNKRVENEREFEKVISKAWAESNDFQSPEVLQKGILKGYLRILGRDLTQEPEYSPSLVMNISDVLSHNNSQTMPIPLPANNRLSGMSPESSGKPPRRQPTNDMPGGTPPINPLTRQGLMHSGASLGHMDLIRSDSVGSSPHLGSPPLPLPIAAPRPVDANRQGSPPQMNFNRQPSPPAMNNAQPIFDQDCQFSDKFSPKQSPQFQDAPRFGPPAVSPPAQNFQPPPRVFNPPSPSIQITQPAQNWLKPVPPAAPFDRNPGFKQPPTEPWDYKPDITYSQMIKQAPSESTLFNTPGMYESERQKMREQLVRQRQREFEDQLQQARNQGQQLHNEPIHPLNFRSGSSQIWSNQHTANTYHSLNDEYLKDLQERVFQSNSEFRKEQLEYQMLNNTINTYQKAANYFERDTDSLTQKASGLTAKAETLSLDISSLSQEKQELLQKIERKRAELLEQKRHAHATSDSDQSRKREMLDNISSLRRLATFKTAELSRVKAKYDELEREYHNHSLIQSKAQQNPMKVIDKSLTVSTLKDWEPWRRRFEDNTGSKARRVHADMGISLAKGESASFLADLNRSVDNLLNNNSDYSSRKYRNL